MWPKICLVYCLHQYIWVNLFSKWMHGLYLLINVKYTFPCSHFQMNNGSNTFLSSSHSSRQPSKRICSLKGAYLGHYRQIMFQILSKLPIPLTSTVLSNLRLRKRVRPADGLLLCVCVWPLICMRCWMEKKKIFAVSGWLLSIQIKLFVPMSPTCSPNDVSRRNSSL